MSRTNPRATEPSTATLISLAHLLVSRRVGEGVAAAGHRVKPSHGAVFSQLGRQPARLTDLARGAQMTPQAMGELVDELETLGYIERTPDPTDRRAKLITLTGSGRQVSADGLDAVSSLERHISEVLGERGHRDLRRMLTRLLDQD